MPTEVKQLVLAALHLSHEEGDDDQDEALVDDFYMEEVEEEPYVYQF